MYFRQLLNDDSACASYLLGCKSKSAFAVVDPHADLVDEYLALAEREGMPIVAVFETHVQADHVSGLPELVEHTGATAYLPERAGVDFEHHARADVEEMARTLYRSLTERLLTLPDHLVLYPAHYSGSVCGRGLSSNPISSIGFERRHNRALAFEGEDAFVAALVHDIPPAPERQTEIMAANRSGRPLTPSR
jgi:glyoxylase-like metal-dependent hydrolase (beta-lactamase superfamily II)